MSVRSVFGPVEFSILWDGDLADMPGWRLASHAASEHIPGSPHTDTFLMGTGVLVRQFSILCPTKTHYWNLLQMVQHTGELLVPAAMNELPFPEELWFGSLMCRIPAVTLMDMGDVRVWNDGAVRAAPTFQRDGLA